MSEVFRPRALPEPKAAPVLDTSPRAVIDTVRDQRTITVALDQSVRWAVDTPHGRHYPNTVLIAFERLVATRNESLNPHDWRISSVTFIGPRWNRTVPYYDHATQRQGTRPGAWTEETHRVTATMRELVKLPPWVLDIARAYRPLGPEAATDQEQTA